MDWNTATWAESARGRGAVARSGDEVFSAGRCMLLAASGAVR